MWNIDLNQVFLFQNLSLLIEIFLKVQMIDLLGFLILSEVFQ